MEMICHVIELRELFDILFPPSYFLNMRIKEDAACHDKTMVSQFPYVTRARFLSLALSKLRLCSANHRPGYWSNLPCDWSSTAWAYSEPGPVFCLLLWVSSDSAQPITGQVTEVTCPVIGRAQPELTPSKRQNTGPGVASISVLDMALSKYYFPSPFGID